MRSRRLGCGAYFTRAHVDPSRKFGSMEEQAFLLASAFQERGGLFLPVFPAGPEAVGRAATKPLVWRSPPST